MAAAFPPSASRSSFEEVLTWEQADAVLVTPIRHTGTPAICPLVGTPRSRGEIPPGEDDGDVGADEGTEEGTDDAAEGSELDRAASEADGEESLSEPLSSEESDEERQDGEERTRGGSKQSEGAARAADGNGDARVDAGVGEDGGDADLPSFVYQRRKFVLKRDAVAEHHEDGEGGDDKDEQEDDEEGDDRGDVGGAGDTFGLVKLPIGRPLGR